MISHIAIDSFDLKKRLDKHCPNGTTLSTCDIKSLDTNISYNLFYTTVEYGLKNCKIIYRYCDFLINNLSLKASWLKLNYFYINGAYIHQINVTAMENEFALVGSNLVVAYEEVKMFALFPQLYTQDFVDLFILNYFWFLDDIFHKWLENFDIKPFYKMINNLEPDSKFIFENPSKSLHFHKINIYFLFNIYCKPTNSFNYLTYATTHKEYYIAVISKTCCYYSN